MSTIYPIVVFDTSRIRVTSRFPNWFSSSAYDRGVPLITGTPVVGVAVAVCGFVVVPGGKGAGGSFDLYRIAPGFDLPPGSTYS